MQKSFVQPHLRSILEHVPREPNNHFLGKQTWPAAKGWTMEIICTYIQEHNLGGQPCNFFAGNAQNTKNQDGRHKYVSFFEFHVWHMVSKGFLHTNAISGTISLIMGILACRVKDRGQSEFKRDRSIIFWVTDRVVTPWYFFNNDYLTCITDILVIHITQ